MNRKSRRNGFTLIETLIVLSIFSVLSLTAIVSFKPIQEELIVEQFFDQLQKDILYAQQHAVMIRVPCTLLFDENETGYRIREGRADVSADLIKRRLPEGMKLITDTLGLKVSFLANGNISASGKVRIVYRQQTYQITFYLGKGRFVVSKQ
ncbi:prepilin-type N-terminal cleavage/methylation domain-containing protein [Metabacillus sp. KIGAM252]|uniref:Prepilin-type N-terminal cleavage/methylation domain-containing protein n=1 Tax=Metabacillus flavus TaxID=2823519 RepID=A0ABS5LG17_9BACI|nr:competence type IV pilus minor pilin ComGD [Metabacillus flavus]MBS2969671.1 prepilin-type N-terminal cleavage/methylation domain-containing protein [Metabacillus flavus]